VSTQPDYRSEPFHLRAREITFRYGIGRSWFRELVAAGILPPPFKYGSRMSVWSRAALDSAFSDPTLPSKIAEHNRKRRERRKARHFGKSASATPPARLAP